MLKRHLFKGITSFFILGIISFCFIACDNKKDTQTQDSNTTQNALERIKQNGKIRIGVFSDKPPFGYINANGEYDGFDVYIAKRFAKDLLGSEDKVEFVQVEAAVRQEFLKANKVDIITLGCSKNLVDSEQLMRQFVANGYTVEHDPHKINGEIVVVNTCGFIGDAQLGFFQAMHPDLFGDQMFLGDVHFFIFRIGVDFDQFHPIQQRPRYRGYGIGCGDEKHL